MILSFIFTHYLRGTLSNQRSCVTILFQLLLEYRATVNIGIMIVSFGDKVTSDLYHGVASRRVRKLPNQIHEPALYKLDVINAAQNLNDLKSPPGNRLEPLKGDFKGFYSIRINSQWRIVFRWESNAAQDVQITDYH